MTIRFDVKAHANLTGDARPVQGPDGGPTTNEFTAELIKVSYEQLGVYLVTCIGSSVGSPEWHLRTGIERAVLVADLVRTNDTFSEIVVARTISVSVRVAAGVRGYVQAVAVPIDLSFDAVNFANLQSNANGVGVVQPIDTTHQIANVTTIAANTVAQTLFNPTSGGVTAYNSGLAIFNNSPAGRNLYIRLGATNVSIAAGGFTHKIAAGGYYETPYNFAGLVSGIWDGADAAGYAEITAVL